MTGPGATILALNVGSSSLKVAVRNPELVISVSVERFGTDRASLTSTTCGQPRRRSFSGGLPEAVDAIATELSEQGMELDAVGHRVVHGGPHHYRATTIDSGLLADLHDAIPLAPLHLPADLDAITQARRAWPQARHVACFDTGFHHHLPAISRRLPVSEELVRLGIRRYGFHGLSIQSVLSSHPDLGGAVIAHLGSGCSVTAVADGRSRHTTMSLTPTGGTMSATRAGDLDPEIVLYLIEQHGYSVQALREAFDHESGLAGIAGGRHDLRDLLGAPDDAARQAIETFEAGSAMAIAACATHLDQWDSLVFTGGIGEHATAVRNRICARVLSLRAGGPVSPSEDAAAALAATGLRVLVVPADEERVIDRLTRQLLPDGQHDRTDS
jgi:acetate kinase